MSASRKAMMVFGAAIFAVAALTPAVAQPAGGGFWSGGPGAMMGPGTMMGPGMMRGWGRGDQRNFCNPGAAEIALGLDPGHTAQCLASLGSAFTVERFAACLGTPVGAVRASFGIANNDEDIHRAIDFVTTFRK